MHRQFFFLWSNLLLRPALHTRHLSRSQLDPFAFSLRFPPSTRPLNGTTRRLRKAARASPSTTTDGPRIVFRGNQSQDTIVIKSLVLSRESLLRWVERHSEQKALASTPRKIRKSCECACWLTGRLSFRAHTRDSHRAIASIFTQDIYYDRGWSLNGIECSLSSGHSCMIASRLLKFSFFLPSSARIH